ncbi:hypothetical protein Syun_026874 [Stephania yunnanensis]|uniref:Uncharacterized protein n=1 Tax=Stephania yunnanensis TaxID=152371 RepID=A0AAP0HKI6_9MAGN
MSLDFHLHVCVYISQGTSKGHTQVRILFGLPCRVHKKTHKTVPTKSATSIKLNTIRRRAIDTTQSQSIFTKINKSSSKISSS